MDLIFSRRSRRDYASIHGRNRDNQTVEVARDAQLARESRRGPAMIGAIQQIILVIAHRRQAADKCRIDKNVAGCTGTGATAQRLSHCT